MDDLLMNDPWMIHQMNNQAFETSDNVSINHVIFQESHQ